MGRRVSKGTDMDGGDRPVAAKRGREEAILWARSLVAKGIRVVRLRTKRGGSVRREPAALSAKPPR